MGNDWEMHKVYDSVSKIYLDYQRVIRNLVEDLPSVAKLSVIIDLYGNKAVKDFMIKSSPRHTLSHGEADKTNGYLVSIYQGY